MTKLQAEAFLDGLKKLVARNPTSFDQYGSFKHCTFVFRDPITDAPKIKSMKGFEKEAELWQDVLELFDTVIKDRQKV